MIHVEKDGRLVTLRLDKPRGNAIDRELCVELLRTARELNGDDSVGAVLLASAHPKLFCPGLDLRTLLTYDRAALEEFMRVFGEAIWELYGFSRPLVAALSGHAVAGGCILALTADYRVLRRGAQIGLNELKIGVPLPWSVALLVRASVPPSALADVALLGTSVSDERAVALGLAHELAEGDAFEATCRKKALEFVDRDTGSFQATKRYLRQAVLQEMRSKETDLIPEWVDCWFTPATQERIQKIVASLGARG
jgi:enoyl-CoA hydratase/carnithine racemase